DIPGRLFQAYWIAGHQLDWTWWCSGVCVCEVLYGCQALVLGGLHEREDVDDEGHAAVTQNGRRRDARNLLVVGFKVLDHHLVLTDEVVDQQGEAHVLHLQDDGNRAGHVGFSPLHVENFVQRDHGQVIAAHLHDVFRFGNGPDLIGRRLHGFGDVAERQNEGFFTDTHRHAVENGERERQHDADGRAFARLGEDLNMAAHALDVASHDVHAHATARDFGDLLGGGKAGCEDQRPEFFVGRALVHGKALSHGLLEDFFAIQARAVVAHLDHDLPTVMLGGHGDGALGILAGRNTRFGHFDAVVDAVAHQVGERVDDAFDEAFVEFGGGALRDQLDALVHAGSGFAHHAREAAEDVIHGHHADRHHGFLQVARIAIELFDAVQQAVVFDGIKR